MPTPFRVSLDRIEGDRAVLVPLDPPARPFDVPLAALPAGVREGEVLLVSFALDPAARAALEADVQALQRDLAKKDDGGDFEL